MTDYRFLIDVNLPKFFSFFNSDIFEFVIDINGKWPDRDIWDYARDHGLVIVTKDTDFYHRCLLDSNPVKVIHIRLGNVLIRDLHIFFQTHWQTILEHLSNAKMIIATSDRIEVIPF
jgi:predicted nuclease of predicted toxin-antitoxin system